MNNGSQFTSSSKDFSELDQFAKQISTFLFPKRRFLARSAQHKNYSVTIWKENEHYFLLYVTKEVMRSDAIGTLLDTLSVALDQIGIQPEEAQSRITVNLFAQDYELNLLERIRLIVSKTETHSWTSSQVEQREFVMVKEAKSPLRQDAKSEGLRSAGSGSSFLEGELSSAEISEFAQLGLDLRKLQ